MKETFERLHALGEINAARKYLEIGVHKGATFTQARFPYKVAVDPEFRFDTVAHADRVVYYHEMTSDDFTQFSYHTFRDHGQTVVYFDTRKDFWPVWNSLIDISSLGYGDFVRQREHFNFSDYDEVLAAVRKCVSASGS